MRRRPLRLLLLGCVALTAGLAGCNAHDLTPIDDSLRAVRVEWSPRLESNQVDILWVVDNSGSMQEEQIELSARFDEFVIALADLQADFHMAVVTTDSGDRGVFQVEPGESLQNNCFAAPELLAYCDDIEFEQRFMVSDDYLIDPDDPSQGLDSARLSREFRCAATVGDCGNGFERGLQTMVEALSDENLDGPNAGFLRDDAFLVVIFLTDEDDCSNNDSFQVTRDADCYAAERREQLVPVERFYEQLVEMKSGANEKVLIAGIIGVDDRLPPQTFTELDRDGPRFSCISELSAGDESVDARDGERYRELILMAESRGLEESICQGNFSSALNNIGEILRKNLDLNCLRDAPRTCQDVETDCPLTDTCGQPPSGPLTSGDRFCSSFELEVEIQRPGDVSFETLRSPGTAGQAEPNADAEFFVDYDAASCRHGVAFSFAPGARPPAHSRYRVSYATQVDVERAGQGGDDSADESSEAPAEGEVSE